MKYLPYGYDIIDVDVGELTKYANIEIIKPDQLKQIQ